MKELPASDVQALLRSARRLKRAAEAGHEETLLLRGKNIAVLCDVDEERAFEAAAKGLGARVTRIPLDKALMPGSAGGADEAARMLGRLYDALECDGLTDADAERLQRAAGVPVLNGLARPDHPLKRLLQPASNDPVDLAALAPADQRYLLQALLVSVLG